MPRIQTAPRKRLASAKEQLEVRVLRNIDYIDTPDRVRLWCKVALITPPEDGPLPTQGMIRGYNDNPRQVKENFTIYYRTGQDVQLRRLKTRPQLVVGTNIYSISSDDVALETKRFSDTDKMWDYIAEEIRKSKF